MRSVVLLEYLCLLVAPAIGFFCALEGQQCNFNYPVHLRDRCCVGLFCTMISFNNSGTFYVQSRCLPQTDNGVLNTPPTTVTDEEPYTQKPAITETSATSPSSSAPCNTEADTSPTTPDTSTPPDTTTTYYPYTDVTNLWKYVE